MLCLFSAQIGEEPASDSYTIEVPEEELTLGHIESGETYRVALLSPVDSSDAAQSGAPSTVEDTSSQIPVAVGDLREVEIEDTGEQGDGVARIDGGYVVIVPETEIGDRVTVRITEARETVSFAEVVEYHDPQEVAGV